MQQGRKSSGGQGLPDPAAEEQATKRGTKRPGSTLERPPNSNTQGQGRNSLSPLFAFFVWAVLHSALAGMPLTRHIGIRVSSVEREAASGKLG